ncbi:MAG TPA: hypothetical protein VEH27_00460 [Methylomirabilota bacterium]|nr:hypothetical protein [Methylomirabilota bacterium]
MQTIRLRAVAFFVAAAPLICPAQITSPFVENFATDPTLREWRAVGDPQLITWNPSDQNLSVTWDSSRPNTYLRLPLPAIMTRRDDFSAELDLRIHDYAAGVNPQKPGTFQLAFGFQNLADASAPGFLRAAPNAAPNLLEFNFLPDTGFGSTIWPAVLSTNGAMNYSGPNNFSVFDLPLDTPLQIALAYTSSNETATISITADGAPVGPVTSARLATNNVGLGAKFTQFEVDAFAIASYSDAGQHGPFAGSILATGVIDNLVLRFPAAPVQNLRAFCADGDFEARFISRTNWVYRLQTSLDFTHWTAQMEPLTGTGEELVFKASNADRQRFFRIQAQPLE